MCVLPGNKSPQCTTVDVRDGRTCFGPRIDVGCGETGMTHCPNDLTVLERWARLARSSSGPTGGEDKFDDSSRLPRRLVCHCAKELMAHIAATQNRRCCAHKDTTRQQHTPGRGRARRGWCLVRGVDVKWASKRNNLLCLCAVFAAV